MKKNETFHVQKLPKIQGNQSFSGGRYQGMVKDNHKTKGSGCNFKSNNYKLND